MLFLFIKCCGILFVWLLSFYTMSSFRKIKKVNDTDSNAVRILKPISIVFLVLSALLSVFVFVVPGIIDWSEYRENFIQDMSFNKIFLSADPDFSFLDSSVSLGQVSVYDDQNNKILIGDLKLNFARWSILTLSPVIDKVIISNGVYNYSKAHSIYNNYDVQFNNTKFIWPESFNLNDTHVKNLNLKTSGQKISIVKGTVKNGKEEFSVLFKPDSKGYIFNLSSKKSNLSYHGNENNGIIEANGDELAKIISIFRSNLFVDSDFISQVAFSCGAKYKKSNDGFSLDDIIFNSKAIKLNGSFLYSGDEVKSEIYIDNIDFDQSSNSTAIRFLMGLISKISTFANNGYIKLNAKDILYNKIKIPTFVSNNKISNGKLLVKEAKLDLPGSARFVIDGVLSSNSVRPNFDGYVKLQGDNFNDIASLVGLEYKNSYFDLPFDFRSDVFVLPYGLMFKHFEASLSDSAINGQLTISDFFHKKVRGFVNFEKMNFDLFLGSFNRMSILKDIIPSLNIRVSVDNSNYLNIPINHAYFELDYDDDYYNFEKFEFLSNNSDLSGSFLLINDTVDSQFEFDLLSKNFSFTDLPINNNFVNIGSDENKKINVNTIKWSKKFFDFPQVMAKGYVNIHCDSLETQSGIKAKNFNFLGDFSDGLLSISDLSMNVAEGDFSMLGNLGLESESSVSMSVSGHNLNIGSFLPQLIDVRNIDGVLSFAGKFKSDGRNPYELISNLNGEMKMLAKNVNVNGLNIDETIDSFFKINSKADLVKKVRVDMFEGSTILDDLEGSTNFKNGVAATSMRFVTKRSSGVLSSNLSLRDFSTNSVMRLFFVPPSYKTSVLSSDLKIQGSVWKPKIFFDNNKLYDLVSKYQ